MKRIKVIRRWVRKTYAVEWNISPSGKYCPWMLYIFVMVCFRQTHLYKFSHGNPWTCMSMRLYKSRRGLFFACWEYEITIICINRKSSKIYWSFLFSNKCHWFHCPQHRTDHGRSGRRGLLHVNADVMAYKRGETWWIPFITTSNGELWLSLCC